MKLQWLINHLNSFYMDTSWKVAKNTISQNIDTEQDK